MKIIKSEKGFTLVELLLVMAIIGILAGIIFISIGPARKRAKVTAFKQSMRDIAIAATACIDADGEIEGSAIDSSVCSPELGIGNIPELKHCGGGGETPMAISVVDGTAKSIDFEFSSVCPITPGSTGLNCNAICTVNGCVFGNSAIVGEDDYGNGCVKVK